MRRLGAWGNQMKQKPGNPFRFNPAGRAQFDPAGGWRAQLVPRFAAGWRPAVWCGDGWRDLILGLVRELDATGTRWELNECKEKMGGLRFYIDAAPAETEGRLQEIIRGVEDRSYRTCEDCGAVGELRTIRFGGVRTLCQACAHAPKYAGLGEGENQ